jgi:hypothetical protein
MAAMVTATTADTALTDAARSAAPSPDAWLCVEREGVEGEDEVTVATG